MRNFRPEKLRLDTREIYLRWRSPEGAYVLVEPLVVPGVITVLFFLAVNYVLVIFVSTLDVLSSQRP